MSLLSIAVKGDLEQYQREEIALMKAANHYALQVGSETLKGRLSAQTVGALGARLGKTWKARVYTNGDAPRAALVWTRAGGIIAAHMADTVILPKQGRFLAIPTGFNRAGGRRGGKVRITPKQMVASRMAFTRPRKGGPGLVWFLKVTLAQSKGRAKVRDLAMAGGLVRVGRYGRSTREILQARAVPMFILVPNIRLRRRLDLEAEVRGVESELPDFLAEGYAFHDTGRAS